MYDIRICLPQHALDEDSNGLDVDPTDEALAKVDFEPAHQGALTQQMKVYLQVTFV